MQKIYISMHMGKYIYLVIKIAAFLQTRLTLKNSVTLIYRIIGVLIAYYIYIYRYDSE